MMHGSRVYHPKFIPFAPRCADPTPHDAHFHNHLRDHHHRRHCHHYQRIFDSRSRYSSTFSFSFCPKAFRSSPVQLRFVLELPRRGFTIPRPRRRRLKLRRCRCRRRLYPQGILLLRIKPLLCAKKENKICMYE